ncbi:MAG TPA: ATP-binding cassette domain-containing protein [Candidatus Dormibacteraeota bacterium]|nr:ATP-binding cassette domain-containing protein [Candidatus Dormibacteraeota bacterium]
MDAITFTVQPGEMVGYIGPNGAGKSTTVKMLTGILYPSSGTVRVAGQDPARERVALARRIGVVFGQRRQLWWDLPLRDSFDILRHVYRVPLPRFQRNLATFADLLDLGPFLGTPVRQLSLGQVMRGELTAALLHDPEVVFLDEPTIGLDVESKGRALDFLAALNRERGTTVLMTTHDLADLERLCPRMLIIDQGRLIFDGPVAQIRECDAERTLVVDLEAPQPPLAVAGVEEVRAVGRRQWLRFRRNRVSAAALIAQVAAVAPIVDLAVEGTPIEEIVRRIYREGMDGLRPAAG